jgi:hypothetical protein
MSRWAASGLAACVLGLALSPLAYVGVLGGFSPVFALITMPPVLLGIGYLLRIYVSKPGAKKPWAVLEALSWLVIGVFLVLVLGVNLLTRLEGSGLQSCVLLTASAICLPVVLWRETALRARMETIPPKLATALLLVLLAATASLAALYLLTPARFV